MYLESYIRPIKCCHVCILAYPKSPFAWSSRVLQLPTITLQRWLWGWGVQPTFSWVWWVGGHPHNYLFLCWGGLRGTPMTPLRPAEVVVRVGVPHDPLQHRRGWVKWNPPSVRLTLCSMGRGGRGVGGSPAHERVACGGPLVTTFVGWGFLLATSAGVGRKEPRHNLQRGFSPPLRLCFLF